MIFPTMRRSNKAIPEEEAQALLRDARRGVLAVNGTGGYPYAIPVNYLYDSQAGKIYFHGSRAGHKAEAIRQCGKVCCTVYGNETVREESWAPYWESVVVFGQCRLVEDREQTVAQVRRIAAKYYPSAELIEEEIAKSGRAVQLYEITVEHLTGKRIQER